MDTPGVLRRENASTTISDMVSEGQTAEAAAPKRTERRDPAFLCSSAPLPLHYSLTQTPPYLPKSPINPPRRAPAR